MYDWNVLQRVMYMPAVTCPRMPIGKRGYVEHASMSQCCGNNFFSSVFHLNLSYLNVFVICAFHAGIIVSFDGVRLLFIL